MIHHDLTPLIDVITAHDLPLDDEILERFDALLDLLHKGRKRFNLIGPLPHEAILTELFADSLMPLTFGAPPSPILDVGTGAGFPGIPIKILYPDLPVTLIEPRSKRFRFLGHVIRTLGLTEIERIRGRVEDLELHDYGMSCSKAVFPPSEWIAVAAPRTRVGGYVSILTATDAWDDEARRAADLHRLSSVAERRYRWKPDAPERIALLLQRNALS